MCCQHVCLRFYFSSPRGKFNPRGSMLYFWSPISWTISILFFKCRMWKTQKCVEFSWIEFQFEGMAEFQWKKLSWIYEWTNLIVSFFYGNYEILCHWKFWKFFYHESGLKLFESKCFSRRVFYYHLSWKFLLEILFQLFAMWSNNLFILSTQTTLHMTILTQLLIAIFVNNCAKL